MATFQNILGITIAVLQFFLFEMVNLRMVMSDDGKNVCFKVTSRVNRFFIVNGIK